MSRRRCDIVLVSAEPASVVLAMREGGLGDCVRVARTRRECAALLAEEPADLVLVDLDLPGEDALELVREMRADWHTATIPVLVLAASVERGDRASGATNVVVKPLEFAKLVEAASQFSLFWRSIEREGAPKEES